jgi:phytoene dehydrogenase-like protein
MVDAVVVGSGPNGLVAANLLADRGWRVTVLEAASEPGGAVRSTVFRGRPDFVRDPFSGFHPGAVASPVLNSLELGSHGLRWCHGPLAVAHPARDGSCAALSRDLGRTAESLDSFADGDGDAWRRLYALWQRVSSPLLQALSTPMPPVRPALRLAAALRWDIAPFARLMLLPARRLIEEEFRGAGASRLIVGHAAHTDVSPETPPSGAVGWAATATIQHLGAPTPQGGAGELTSALTRRLDSRGGTVVCDAPVTNVVVRRRRAVGVRLRDGQRIEASRAVLADVGAPALYRQLLDGERLPARVLEDMRRFRYDLATFKVDWALAAPIPWTATETRQAGLVHLMDGVDDYTRAAAQLAMGLIPAEPFLVLGQYSMVDPTRCPPGTETAWAYTQLPQSPRGDAGGDLAGQWDERETRAFARRMEQRIEELAPGFRDLILDREILAPGRFEAANPNLVAGAMHGGTMHLHQQAMLRPAYSWGRPETPIRGLYLASASAHPGGGVHGGPGANAARAALRWDRASPLRGPRRVTPRR